MTDGRAIAYTRYSMLSRVKFKNVKAVYTSIESVCATVAEYGKQNVNIRF